MDSLPQHGNQAPYVLAPPENGEESSFDFWGVLNRRKWLVFLGLITGMGLGAFYDAQCPTVYKSTAKVKIEPKDPLFMPLSQNSMVPGTSDLSIRHDQLIGQYNIVDRCIRENNLGTLSSLANIGEDDIAQKIIDSLEVIQNKEEQTLYELVYHSTVPENAPTILNNILETYEKHLDDTYQSKTTEVTTLLKSMNNKFNGEYADLQIRLDEAHKKNQAIIVSNGNLTLHQVKVGELERILQRDKEELGFHAMDLDRARTALQGKPADFEKAVWIFKQQKKIILNEKQEGLEKRDLRSIENKIREYEGELRLLVSTFGPGHKKVKALKAEIEEWQKYLQDNIEESEQLFSNALEPEEILRRHVLSLEQQIFDLQGAIDINQAALLRHSLEAARIATVERDVENINMQMEDVREFLRIAEKNLMEADTSDSSNRQEGYYFQVLQHGTYGEPVWPILFVILGAGGLLGCVAGFGLGCLVELADKTFHNPDEIMKQLNVPLIGHVPVIGQSKRYLVENSLIEPIVCSYHRPKSQVSEAFRAVRTALYFNTQGKDHSVIQITSPTPGDGKSTLASNLAVSIAQSGKRILLVDADMRRPRQHGTFGISSKEGFATVLSGQSQWRDVMYECEEIEGLTVMPCGAKPNNPAELCSSPQVKVLIEEMREEFDFVIIDTPPLLAVTDPCPIAARVDGVILCLRIKKNVRVSAERATEMLANLGTKCLGLVVNGVGAQSGYGSQYTYGAYRAGYSYNGYGYGYGYGNGGKYYEEDKSGRQATKHIENQPSP